MNLRTEAGFFKFFFFTYFSSLFEQSDNRWSVSAANCSVQRTHSAAVHMLHGCTVIHQVLHLAQDTFSIIYWYNKGQSEKTVKNCSYQQYEQ